MANLTFEWQISPFNGFKSVFLNTHPYATTKLLNEIDIAMRIKELLENLLLVLTSV
jgi:hypothetical protein